MTSPSKTIEGEFPVLPLRDTIVFPGLITPLLVGRDQSKESIRLSSKENQPLLLVAQREAAEEDPSAKDLYRIGVLANVLQVLSLPDGTLKVLVEGFERVSVKRFIWRGSVRKAKVTELPDAPDSKGGSSDLRLEAMARIANEQFARYAMLNPHVPESANASIMDLQEPAHIANIVAAHLTINTKTKQKLLEITDPARRLHDLIEILQREVEILEMQQSIDSEVRSRIQKSQKDYFLREQLKVIRDELDGEDSHSLSALEEKIKSADLPEHAESAALRELDRLSQAQLHSPQASVSIDYIETLIALPWRMMTDDDLDIARARKTLDKDHYGLDDVKDRVLDYLAVRKLAPEQKGQILCFIGPPGVGKTSIAHSIAKALGRKFVKKSLGGVRDEAEVRGHRRTYVAAMPGGIIKGMSKAGTKNPVFLLDEIDKLSRDFHGDPGAALLEVLDPAENHSFVDHFLEVEYDLSEVFFIATGNWMENIPAVLRDRMEVITFSGYTPTEKVEIAKRHLLPELLKQHGIKKSDVSITKTAIKEIIVQYTREAGVRDLKRKLATLCRRIARKLAENEGGKKISIKPAVLQDYLGPAPFFKDMLPDADVGTATGLAWTEVGGKVMSIEVSFLPGKGSITLTGSLGDVMKESARAALTYVRTNARKFKINCSKEHDVHIHVPAGATPKDGPSAGIALLIALLSAYKKKKADPKIALTGEITLHGRVLPVGGIKEKLLAAHREGVKKVIMPEANKADLQKVPEEVLDKLDISLVKSASQVISECGLA